MRQTLKYRILVLTTAVFLCHPEALIAQDAVEATAPVPANTPAADQQQKAFAEPAKTPGPSETTDDKQSEPTDTTKTDRGLRFNFSRSPWRFVIDWLAEEAGLAVHVGDLPTGSFTYIDDKIYTPDQAIGRVNLFLIPQRYSLVRSNSLLSVISLDDEQSIRQLDAMAQAIEIDELDNCGEHDVVKCLFPLGKEIPTDVALQELTGLMLLREPVVLRNTNQLLVTSTASKLRLVRKVIDSIGQSMIDGEGPIEHFSYGDLDPERVLAQIRPHVGLDPLATLGPDISLSIDRDGGQILASGTRDNLAVVASVIESLIASSTMRKPTTDEFRSHELGEADMQTVVSVLQTLLADEDVRLAPDPKTNQLAVLGNEEVHALVERTVEQLAGSNTVEFKAIRCTTVDPRYAVVVLSQMFGIAGPEDDDAPDDPRALRIEADAYTQRLFVRGTTQEIAEIEKAVSQLTETSDEPQEPNLRLLPYHGDRAKQIVDSARQFWPHGEDIVVLPAPGDSSNNSIEREVNPQSPPEDSKSEEAGQQQPSSSTDRSGRQASRSRDGFTVELAALNQKDSKPRSEIRVQSTPRGILVFSEDAQALKRFEDHIALIAGPGNDSELRLRVFYLKNVAADVASNLLQDIMTAELYGELSESPFGLGDSLASVIGNSSSSSTLDEFWSSGTATVIPDKRLNRIFVYGDAEDIASIEQHLSIIDRERSLAPVKTFGSPRVIRLEHASAEDVVSVVRDAYAGRIAKTAKERQAAELQRQQAAEKSKGRPAQPEPSALTAAPMMTLAIEEKSNSLVITAPEQLAAEVEELVRSLDEEATQKLEVRSLGVAAPQVHELLLNLLGDEPKRSSTQKVKSDSKD